MNPRRFAPLALLAAGAVAGGVLASTFSASADTPTPAPTAGQHSDTPETPLTGDTKGKVEAAVKAKYPGATVSGLETSRGGDYEATVTKAGGTPFEVHVTKDLTVLEDRGGFGGRGPQGPPETPLTGDPKSKVEAAVKAKYPGATVSGLGTSRDGEYEATVTQAGATPFEVHVSKDLATISEGHGGHRGGPHDGPPPAQQG